jgi:hypothetical protein
MPVLVGSSMVPPGSHEKIPLRCSVVAYGLQRKLPVIRVSNKHRVRENTMLSSSALSQVNHSRTSKKSPLVNWTPANLLTRAAPP